MASQDDEIINLRPGQYSKPVMRVSRDELRPTGGLLDRLPSFMAQIERSAAAAAGPARLELDEDAAALAGVHIEMDIFAGVLEERPPLSPSDVLAPTAGQGESDGEGGFKLAMPSTGSRSAVDAAPGNPVVVLPPHHSTSSPSTAADDDDDDNYNDEDEVVLAARKRPAADGSDDDCLANKRRLAAADIGLADEDDTTSSSGSSSDSSDSESEQSDGHEHGDGEALESDRGNKTLGAPPRESGCPLWRTVPQPPDQQDYSGDARAQAKKKVLIQEIE